ncbi:adenosylmethionine decarboxylase [Pseudoduganella sp. RAF53_2]|uniref:adenosylmethionine decarboxylase n=1 Tax=unclassified Pseudoduganella TaxID=2637179 RepID=UPI003F94F709
MSAHVQQLYQPAGVHLLADMSGIAAELLTDCSKIEQLLRDAATAAGAHVLHSHFHGFGEGQGVTGVVLLAESHISIHTWPETGFAAADIFMCGRTDPQRALSLLREALHPSGCAITTIRRIPPR